MTSKTHDAIAFASLITLAVSFPPIHLNLATFIVALIANIVGATLPDIDQAINRLWDLLPGGNFIGRILRRLFISHRTLSHSLLGIFLMSKLSFWLCFHLFNPAFINPLIINYSLLIGFISHLLADAVTRDGIPLFWPIMWKVGFPPFKFLRLTTGHWVEKFIVFPTVIIYTFIFAFLHWTKLLSLVN